MKKTKILLSLSLMASPLTLIAPLCSTGCGCTTPDTPSVPTATEIVVTNMPKTSYSKGDTLDLSGLEVNKIMSDGSKVVLQDSEYTTNYITGDTLDTVGTLPIKVTLNSCALSTSFNITVTDDKTATDFVLIKTSSGYCIDGLNNPKRETITSIVVPESIDDIPVVEISKGAFKGCINLQSITLPFIGHTYTASGAAGLFGYCFGDEMYEGCGAYTWQEYSLSDEYEEQDVEYAQYAIPRTLKTVTITNASYIKPGAFSNCKYLRNITINSSTNSPITEIGNYAFYRCMALKEFNIPSNVQIIGRKSFQACYNLKEITIPSETVTVKHNAFSNCISAIKAIVPASVTTMGKLVFENFVSGLVCVEAETAQPNWDPQWITNDISVVYNYTTGETYYTDLLLVAICGSENDKYAYAISWLGSEHGDITIPATVTCGGQEYPVRKLGPNMFNGDTELQSVTISNNVESLGASCFEGCTNLTSITFPDSLTTIGSNCFYGCDSLETVDFNKVSFIGASAFEAAAKLHKITFHNIETISQSAFKDCTQLEFCRESGETNPLTFPKTIKTIGDYAFKNAAKVKTGGTSTTTPYIGDIVFERDNENDVTIGESAFEDFGIRTRTEEYTYYIRFHVNFNWIKLKTFETSCFKNCYMHTIYNFPKNVETIKDYALYNCSPSYIDPENPTKLKDTDRVFTMPTSITSVGNYGFWNWGNNKFVFTSDSKLKTIGNYAFRSCSFNHSTTPSYGFNELLIPDSVESIGVDAFRYCYGLRKITFPNDENCKITRLESGTFGSCTSLGIDIDGNENWITIPTPIIYLGSSLFYGCKELRYVHVKGAITTLGSSCFYGCKSLEHGKAKSGGGTVESLKFDDNFESLTSLGSSIYQGCDNLVWAPFPGQNGGSVTPNMTSIPSYEFAECKSLSDFNVLGNVTSIGTYAFAGCTTMTQITGMNAVKYIYQSAFSGCKGLTKIDLPSSCHTICENAFADCKALGKDPDNKFVLPTDITQKYSTESTKGMGVTPFLGWTSDQTIYFREANIDKYDESGNVITKWGWTLMKQGSGADIYYTCEDSGGAAHFVLYTEA